MKETTSYEAASAVQEILSRFYIYIDKTVYDKSTIIDTDGGVYYRTIINIARKDDIATKYAFPFYYAEDFLMDTYNPFPVYSDLLTLNNFDIVTLLDIMFMWYQWTMSLNTTFPQEWEVTLYEEASEDIATLEDSMRSLFSDVEYELLADVFFK